MKRSLNQPQRPLRDVPRGILVSLVVATFAQAICHRHFDEKQAAAANLPHAPPAQVWRIAGLGDDILMAKLTMLWLQGFDNQPGVSIPFKSLDYAALETWLQLALALDPRAQYPLLAAARLYADVPDEQKQRQMMDFVFDRFHEDPQRRWPWLAHVAVLAKHRLGDMSLALKYATALADTSLDADIPRWAQQMEIFLLEDIGEIDSARILIGGLLDSAAVTDPHEVRFLKERLEKLERSALRTGRIE